MARRKATRKRLFLIDAMSYVFRAYHAPTPQRFATAQGVPTQAVFLFNSMLGKLLREHEPDYVAVVFESLGPTVRDQIFADYKAQRPPAPEDLKAQIPYIFRLCEALRLPVLQHEGYEADDVIGTLACRASDADLDAVVVTSDKDMLQLVHTDPSGSRPSVQVFSPTRDLFYDEAEVENYFGVPPEQVTDVVALMGDAIDNIPGARGIGQKGARQLITAYGSAEAAMERHAEVKQKKYQEALRDQQDQIRLSKQLATLHTDLPVPFDLKQLARQEPDSEQLVALYTELGFTSLLKEQLPARPAKTEKVDYRELTSAEELKEFLSASHEAPLAFWCETSGEPPVDLEVTALAFSARAGEAVFLPVPRSGAKRKAVLEAVQEFLEDAKRPKAVHDAKTTALALAPPTAVLAPAGIELRGVEDDTALYSYLIQPTTAKHSLEDVAARRLNLTLSGAVAERADFVARIRDSLREEMKAQGLTTLYEEIERPLSPVLASMERNGIRLDPKALRGMSASFEKEIESLTGRIYELAGTEFNLNSPKQLGEILYEKLQLPVPGRRGKTKAPSTSAAVLEELAAQHELPGLVLEYRGLAKLKSTYIDVLPTAINPRTGRLHTRFHQTGTATGRLSSSDPNLQNIPIRTEVGNRIRAAFVAEPGWQLVGADYSQVELRVLAHMSEDKVLIEAFQRGEDVHARTAQEVLDMPPLMQTSEHRRVAKMINFGIIYGLTAYGLATRLGIEPAEAQRYIDAYFQRYAGVKKFRERLLRETRDTGFTRTLFGRRRPIPEINAQNATQRNFAERTALNSPLQGTAADVIKLAMVGIHERLREEKLRTRMLLQVHDELLFEVPEDELDTARALIKSGMEQVHALRVPLLVDMHTGANWSLLK